MIAPEVDGRAHSAWIAETSWQRRKIMDQPSSINLMLLGLNGWPRSLR